MSELSIQIEPLGAQHDRGVFRCGVNFIDNFLQKKSIETHDLFKARVYVATINGGQQVAGFYTLSLTALQPTDTSPEDAQAKFRTWAIPLVYLGQIGVHEDYQRKCGIGSALMVHAFSQTVEIANMAGCFGLMLDAIDEERSQWYQRLGFQAFDTEADGRIKMICPLGTIRAALSQVA